MKAIVYHRYGSPDVLKLEEVEKPIPTDDQILIKVLAVSFNPFEWHHMRGKPLRWSNSDNSRSIAKNLRPGTCPGSNSTSTSTSLSFPKSSRNAEPNTDSLRT